MAAATSAFMIEACGEASTTRELRIDNETNEGIARDADARRLAGGEAFLQVQQLGGLDRQPTTPSWRRKSRASG